MAARESAAVAVAAAFSQANPLWSLSMVAAHHGIALSSLRRALRRRGEPPRPHPKGYRVALPPPPEVT